jgi:hypothetical protein
MPSSMWSSKVSSEFVVQYVKEIGRDQCGPVWSFRPVSPAAKQMSCRKFEKTGDSEQGKLCQYVKQ